MNTLPYHHHHHFRLDGWLLRAHLRHLLVLYEMASFSSISLRLYSRRLTQFQKLQ